MSKPHKKHQAIYQTTPSYLPPMIKRSRCDAR